MKTQMIANRFWGKSIDVGRAHSRILGLCWAISCVLWTIILLFCGPVFSQSDPGSEKNVGKMENRSLLEDLEEAQTGKLQALLVGVSKYKLDTGDEATPIKSLRGPANDVKAMEEFLNSQKRVFTDIHIVSLVNEKATGSEIRKQRDILAERAGENDTVLLYFSGHGTRAKRRNEFYFVPYDGDFKYVESTCVNMMPRQFLQGIKAKRKIVITDACHSGAGASYSAAGGEFKSGGQSAAVERLLEAYIKEMSESRGVAVLMSSAAGEESVGKELSLFTMHLLDGLKGGADFNDNGIVTLSEAFAYARERVDRDTLGGMHPIVDYSGGDLDSFPLAYCQGCADPRKVLARALIHFAESGETDKIKDLLDRKPYIKEDREEFSHRSALMVACQLGHLDVVRALVHRRVNLEAQDKSGATPLIAAARNGHAEIVRHLLESRADIHARDENGNTALHAAARHEETDEENRAKYGKIVNLLLRQDDVVVDVKNGFGSTPLALAAYVGDPDIVKALLAQNADPNSADLKERTPFSTACRYGHQEIVRILLDHGADVEKSFPIPQSQPANSSAGATQAEATHSESKKTYSPKNVHGLMRAAILDDPEELIHALKTNVDVNVETKSGDTALSLASGLGHEKVLRLLLEKGADVNRRLGSSKATPLMWAAHNGKLEVVKLLVQKGAKIGIKNSKGRTALTEACEEGKRKTVELLCQNGADYDAQTEDGYTPLALAVKFRRKDVVEYLLAQGAKPDVRLRSDGSTALMIAVENGERGVVELLLKKGADINAAKTDHYGDNALTLACRKGDKKMVELLIDRGANPNSRSARGPAITIAADYGHADIVTLLLAKGADANVRDWQNLTLKQVLRLRGVKNIAGLK